MKGRVAVIGAGIVGVCCAGWLQRKGWSATLIDRDGPGEGTSFGNAGSLYPSAVMPVAMPGMIAQIPGWLLDPLGPLTVRWSYLPSALPWLWRFLRCANVDQMWRTVNPHRLTRTLSEQVVADGGRLLRSEVRDIRVQGGERIVRTAEHEETADAVVVAAGAWSQRLAARLGDRFPLETQRGYHATLANPGVSVRRMVNRVRRRVFATPMEMGLRFAGTVEIAGLEAEPNWRRADVFVGLARQMYPEIDSSEVTRWMGHRPCLPDSLPVIGPSPNAAGIFYAFGHQHVGMCGAPGTGRAIAELVSGEQPQIDLGPFRADRF